ncbi:MAG TPA: RICIN domain-containing protein [Jatrophihabitans sp.]|nr:RICIN domain-containing protein [Jatrophihabitans sp.]
MAALAVTGIALTTGPAAAGPSPKASPSALAARAAASLVAARPASIHASKDDTFIAHAVISTREGLQYVPYDRTYKGLPVYGGDFVVTTDSTGRVLSTSVAQNATVDVSTTAAQSAAQAASTARGKAAGKVVDSVSAGRKVVYALGSTPHLAYETVVASHTGAIPSKLHVFTDANTATVLYSYDEVREGSGTGRYNGPNPLAIDTSQPTSGTWTMTDPIRSGISCNNYGGGVLSGSDDVWGNGVGTDIETGCVDALFDVQHEWSMLSAWLGRNGINGSGGGYPIYVGLNQVNAFWNGSGVLVGHNTAGEWVSSLDVIGHEFGHAIDQFTPGGIGSSAVAEFTGDVFGALTEAYANEAAAYDPPDYQFGEEVNFFGQGPDRYMYNPSLAGHPNCYSSSIPSTETHAAAGPGNHWFYLLAEGTNPTNGQPTSPTCNGSTVTGIGIQTAGNIFYNAMLAKTTNMSYFQYRTATLNAAKNLTPGDCATFNKVKAAWDAVSVPAQAGEPTCGRYAIRNASGKCLEISNSSNSNGAPAQQWDCVGQAGMYWRIVEASLGYYLIQNYSNNKCLEIANSSNSLGARAQQWDCVGQRGALWRFSGPYIVNSSGGCLEIENSSSSNGARAQQWNCVGQSGAQWTLVPS